jgi:hypothetical protein
MVLASVGTADQDLTMVVRMTGEAGHVTMTSMWLLKPVSLGRRLLSLNNRAFDSTRLSAGTPISKTSMQQSNAIEAGRNTMTSDSVAT